MMGVSTFVRRHAAELRQIGVAAPVVLIVLRLLQGLALGGEYGGAATYVAEHAPQGKRGLYTRWIQTTATLGLFLSLLVILGVPQPDVGERLQRLGLAHPVPASRSCCWGSRSGSGCKLNESPVFQRMKEEGKGSKAPLTESFGKWPNLKLVLLALFGLTAGQAVVWYTGQFYALFFLTQTLKVDADAANLMIAGALLLGTPFFVVFGWLSDRIGRKPIIMAGCLLAVPYLLPDLQGRSPTSPTRRWRPRSASAPVVVIADPDECSFQFNPVGTSKFTSSCDVAKSALVKRGVPYENQAAPAGTVASVTIGATVIPFVRRQRPPRRKAAGAGVRQGARRRARRRRSTRPRRTRRAINSGDGGGAALRPGALRDHGLRPDRGDAGRDVPDPHPLHLDVAALPHRQRLVRRLPAHHRLRHRGGDGQHLLRASGTRS